MIFLKNYEIGKSSPEVILQVKLALPVIELRYKVVLEWTQNFPNSSVFL